MVRSRPASIPGWELVVDSIGPKVRTLRRDRGLTLQQLAHLADVSAAAVHKVERSEMVPTITTLLKIAGALGTPIRHFVSDDTDTRPLAVHTRAPAGGPAATGSATSSVTITGPADRFRASGAVTRLEPGTERVGRPAAGENLVVVLDGRLTFTIEDETYTVAAGESLHFPTHVEHRWSNPGPDPARAVWVTVPEN
ncbi:helix-turn-helix domain-containing protein [Pseudonocardia bannensis]|uniref:Helix-turn-helix transcriptional regulator n=1 Tax=Pseudonocardia bannensis TaxID=630973 RepID=A0A848DMI6_9PSEU|nr:XRE family transcriptional regulator [Pseudonocardia bannensis]NMH93942.1 helix-turn-helix transcriptional regulator [Pseudonocardia bannensis]